MIEIDYLKVEIDETEIALIREVKIDNPLHIPAMPSKGVKAQGEPYSTKIQVVLKSGHIELLDISLKNFKEYYASR